MIAELATDRDAVPAVPRADVAPLIELDGVNKSFGGVRALRGVHFDLRPGEVHALLGQNGAGKSTLIKILAGVTPRDQGQIRIDGVDTEFRSSAAARAAGIGVVYQELSLVPQMSIADNLYLAREPSTFGLVQRRRMLREARQFIAGHGLDLDPATPVHQLPFAYRQLTEIAKALSGNVRILILDEPTSSLSKGEEDILFDAVEEVTKRGVGVIYITHRLSEVFRLSDRVTVLRDGANAGTFATSDTDMATLVAAIVGTETAAADEAASPVSAKDAAADPTRAPVEDIPLVELRDAVNDRLRGVNLAVRPGEIVGLAGMIGSGRTEILETIFGLRRLNAGQLLIDGEPTRVRGPVDAIRHGIGLVPEDRHVQGLVLEHTIERNTVLPWLNKLRRFGLFRSAAARKRTQQTMAALSVKAPSPSTRVRNLSGGNQQKVVFGRWQEPGMRLLLLDEPTVGVDVGAREQIYDVVRHVVGERAAALVVSSDLAELLLLCDRIAVVVDGNIVSVHARADLRNEEHLHQLVQEQQQ
ncbi:MAG: sugar ABC transporter ATP-binding protein [Alphaproteobacteria bacterium]